MGSSESKTLTYNASTPNVYDLKVKIINRKCNLFYKYSKSEYKFTFKIKSKDNLKMEIFTHTALSKIDCYNLVEYIFEEI